MRWARVLVSVAITLAFAAGLCLSATAGTYATFTDTGAAATGTFSAATLGKPTNPTCNAGVLGAGGVSWTAPSNPAPTGYLVTYQSASGGGTATTTGTTWKPNAGLLDLGVRYTVSVQATYGNWTSASSTTVQVQVTSALFVPVSLTCP